MEESKVDFVALSSGRICIWFKTFCHSFFQTIEKMSDDETEVKSSKRTKLIGGGIFGAICLFLVIFLPIWFLVIDVDDEEKVEIAQLAECNADGLGSDVDFLL